jgi:hypothetical protein
MAMKQSNISTLFLNHHLNSSLGIVIYQEQIMSMGRDIGGLGLHDVTALRKAMSKSLGKEYFDQFGDRFKAGAEQIWHSDGQAGQALVRYVCNMVRGASTGRTLWPMASSAIGAACSRLIMQLSLLPPVDPRS